MKIIVSPAKKMRQEDSLSYEGVPIFLEKTTLLMKGIQALSYEDAKALWKCNDKIATLNVERFANMSLTEGLSPAILSYEGLQYQHMAPEVFDRKQLEWVQEHLRILSGFYGVVRPLDGIVPYRLEMQAKGDFPNSTNLYDFWGKAIYQEIIHEDGVVLNLASKEYSKCVEKYLTAEDRFIVCQFVELIDGKLKQKGTLAKMARGEMVRFLAESQGTAPEDAKKFDKLGFVFAESYSTETNYVFIKKD